MGMSLTAIRGRGVPVAGEAAVFQERVVPERIMLRETKA
jgi:hypothetical protein